VAVRRAPSPVTSKNITEACGLVSIAVLSIAVDKATDSILSFPGASGVTQNSESGNRVVETTTVPERKLDVRSAYSEAGLHEVAARWWAVFVLCS
jgi:hypothetical protein